AFGAGGELVGSCREREPGAIFDARVGEARQYELAFAKAVPRRLAGATGLEGEAAHDARFGSACGGGGVRLERAPQLLQIAIDLLEALGTVTGQPFGDTDAD